MRVSFMREARVPDCAHQPPNARAARTQAGVGAGRALAARLTAALLCIAPAAIATGGPEPDSRRVRQFDFNERPRGNFEPVPMNWAQYQAPGYPRYLEARFDDQIGRSAAPSMVLRLMGGNVASVYEGRDIEVDSRCDYRVTAWVRTEELHHARASLTAFYRDRSMRPVAGSERRSRLIGESGNAADWQRVDIELGRPPAGARWIGLGFWLEQPQQREGTADAPRVIRREDMRGAAWIDDIEIVRLPRLNLELDSPAHLYAHDQPIALRVQASDREHGDVACRLVVRDWTGAVVRRSLLESVAGDSDRFDADLSSLAPGWYAAEVSLAAQPRASARDLSRDAAITETTNDAVPLVCRRVCFARMPATRNDSADRPRPAAPMLPMGNPTARMIAEAGGVRRNDGFIGTTVGFELTKSPHTLKKLTREAGLGAVKAPVWPMLHAESESADRRAAAQLLHDWRREDVEVIALLARPPADLAATFPPMNRGLLDVLSAPPERWRDALSPLVTRLGETARFWQIGPDGDADPASDPRWAAAMAQVRREIETLLHLPRLATPWHALYPPDARSERGAAVSVAIPSLVPAERIGDQFAAATDPDIAESWAVIEPLDADRYERHARLADWARRVILARAAGATRVFVPAPWAIDEDGRLSPDETLLPIRALNHALADVVAIERVLPHASVEAWLFARGDGSGTVVAWCNADGDSTPILLACGDAARAYDLFGRAVDCGGDARAMSGAAQTFHIGLLPTLILPVDSNRVRLQSTLRLERGALALDSQTQSDAILVRNTLGTALRGRLSVREPAGWSIRPLTHEVLLEPGDQGRFELAIRVPANQPSGPTLIETELFVEGDTVAAIPAVLPVTVGADDLLVEVLPHWSADRLILRQRIVNRSGRTLNLCGYVVAPGRKRLTRLLRNVAPQQSIAQEFELTDPASLRGRPIRVSVEELGGTRRHHVVVSVD